MVRNPHPLLTFAGVFVKVSSMTPRERIVAALNHRETEQVPLDFGGHRSSGISAMAYARLRSHLDLLVEAGYAIRRSEAPRGPGRPRVVYEASAAPDGERNYRLLAEVLAQHLLATSERPGEAANNAGRTWAGLTKPHQHGAEKAFAAGPISEAAAIAEIVRMLCDIGFAPEVSADMTAINLRRCPFRELAEANPEVVCGAHLVMIQGAWPRWVPRSAPLACSPWFSPTCSLPPWPGHE